MAAKARRVLLRISSVLMLVTALPMMLWCFNLINNAALDSSYGGIGCFVAGIVYVFSMVTAIAGLVFARKEHRYGWCRILAYIQMLVGVLLIVPLITYAVLTLPPLYLLTILYLFAVGWGRPKLSQ